MSALDDAAERILTIGPELRDRVRNPERKVILDVGGDPTGRQQHGTSGEE